MSKLRHENILTAPKKFRVHERKQHRFIMSEQERCKLTRQNRREDIKGLSQRKVTRLCLMVFHKILEHMYYFNTPKPIL